MRTIQAEELSKEASNVLRDYPNVISDPDVLSRLILSGAISENLVAYFTEIIGNEDRGLVDIQIHQDYMTVHLNEAQKLNQVEWCSTPNFSTGILRVDAHAGIAEIVDPIHIKSRIDLCKKFGINFKYKTREEALTYLDGCLAEIEDKTDPVDTIRSIRRSWEM